LSGGPLSGGERARAAAKLMLGWVALLWLLEVVDVVNLADALVSRLAPSPFQEPPALDTARLERLGLTPSALCELESAAGPALKEAKEMLAP
jgi:hypothetical protein